MSSLAVFRTHVLTELAHFTLDQLMRAASNALIMGGNTQLMENVRKCHPHACLMYESDHCHVLSMKE